jgi:hypothetical protein
MTSTATEHAPPASDVPDAKPEGILLVPDVARILGVKPGTVRSYLKESQPMVGEKPGRYADHPFPKPGRLAPATTLWWPASAEKDIREWDNDRPTQSHGKGRQAPGPRGPSKRS